MLNMQCIRTHAIPKRLSRVSEAAVERSLVPFWKTSQDKRDLGVAYAVVAATDPAFRQKAQALLEAAVLRDPGDLLAASQLAQIYDRLGEEEKAMTLAERVVRLDPSRAAVAVNLGAYWIKRGRGAEAIRLWQDALARNPGLTGARINLAVAQFRAGDPKAAEASLMKALQFDSDHALARTMLAEFSRRR
jgi:putative inorganic carbon (HCO3(-)) transporter